MPPGRAGVPFAPRLGGRHFPSCRKSEKCSCLFGVILTVLGLALWSGFGSGWFGRLPGDIRIERPGGGLYFPVVTCIIISILLSLIFSFFRR